MLKVFAQRLAAAFVASVLIAVAAGVVIVASAFGAYAGLKTVVSPAEASALTAAIFAVVTGLIAIIAPKLLAPAKDHGGQGHARRGQAHASPPPDLANAGMAAIALMTDLALSHRLKRQQKAREQNQQSRR